MTFGLTYKKLHDIGNLPRVRGTWIGERHTYKNPCPGPRREKHSAELYSEAYFLECCVGQSHPVYLLPKRNRRLSIRGKETPGNIVPGDGNSTQMFLVSSGLQEAAETWRLAAACSMFQEARWKIRDCGITEYSCPGINNSPKSYNMHILSWKPAYFPFQKV